MHVDAHTHTHVSALCTHICAQIFTKNFLVVHYSIWSLSFKFHKDPMFHCWDICKKLIVTFLLSATVNESFRKSEVLFTSDFTLGHCFIKAIHQSFKFGKNIRIQFKIFYILYCGADRSPLLTFPIFLWLFWAAAPQKECYLF